MCKHEWKVLSETITESKFEHAIKNFSIANVAEMCIPRQMSDATRKHIQVFSCNKCGKLKRFVETI